MGSNFILRCSPHETYHRLDSGYDHGDHSRTWHGPVPSHTLFPCPTNPSHSGKGPAHDGLDMKASSTSRGAANANANDEREDKQRQPKTFFRRLERVKAKKGTGEEECR
jgi:hypothetical protein